MYIPSVYHYSRVSVAQGRLGTGTHAGSHGSHSECVSVLCRLGLSPVRPYTETNSEHLGTIQKRQFSDDPGQNTNIKIGLVVGILVAAFLAVVIAFLWIYGPSIRFREKKKKHRSHKSSSSKSSRSSDGGPPPFRRPHPHPRPRPPPRSAPPPSPPPPARPRTPADDAAPADDKSAG